MNDNSINARCAICGKGYHVCQDSLEQRTFKPWKTVTDTMEHYKIYTAIHLYTTTHDKNTAKAELEKCNLSDLASFNVEIKKAITEILHEDISKEKIKKQTDRQNKATDVHDEINAIDE